MRNLEKLKELLKNYEATLTPLEVAFGEHKASLLALSDALIECADKLIAVAEAAGALDDGLLDGGDSAYLCPETLAARMNKALVDLESVKL